MPSPPDRPGFPAENADRPQRSTSEFASAMTASPFSYALEAQSPTTIQKATFVTEMDLHKASPQRLNASQIRSLHKKEARLDQNVLEEENENHGHQKQSTIVGVIASGLINYLLMFGLCCAYGMIMFDDDHTEHRAIGVKINLATAWIFGLLLACCSRIRVAIGGPDLNPIVFLANMISAVSVDLAKQHGLEFPQSDYRRLLWQEAGRRLAGEKSSGMPTFCVGEHLLEHQEACDAYFWELRATAIFTVTVSTLLLGFVFFCVGRFKLTSYASYVPTCVMEAFLSCVGYKVFKYALAFCRYQPRQFIPAACVGVPLYFIKAYHIGNPAVMIPTMLLLPLGLFYLAVFASGSNLDEQEEWMFPTIENVEFWRIWTDSVGRYENINFRAWLTTLPDLLIMVLVCFIDCVLKILGTEGKLPIKVDKNYEMKLFGFGNLLTAACGSPVGYMQLKFNVINFGIVGNASDNRGGILYALLCAATFFSTIYHFNYLPRFFLGIMLFFAGAGFVAENLWGSRKYLSLREWMQIVVILIIFIIFEKLLYAVLAGVVLTCIDFAVTYAKVRCVSGSPAGGNEVSSARRNLLMQNTVAHISKTYLHIVRLKGFIFFASAQQLITELRQMIESQDHKEAYRRLKFLVFDCTLFDGMDSSTKKALRRLAADARTHKITVYWSHVTSEYAEQLKAQEIITGDHQWFSCLDEAVSLIEERLVRYREKVQDRWVNLHPVFQLQQKLATAHAAFEPFKDIFLTNSARCGCIWQYCQAVEIHKHTSLLWEPGQIDACLFLVHSGSVALFRELPSDESAEEWTHPIAVYHQGWFLNREALMGFPTRYHAIAMDDGELVAWTPSQLARMTRERPQMAAALQRAAMKQQAKDCDIKDEQFDQMAEYAQPLQTDSWHGRRPYLPEQVTTRLKGMQLVRALEAAGFYEHEKDATLPPLPSCIRRDLETAFLTFCQSVSNGEETMEAVPGEAKPVQERSLSWDQAGRALLYAGIFNVGLRRSGCSSLSENEFLMLGHEAAMCKLGVQQRERICTAFKTRAAQLGNQVQGKLPFLELRTVMEEAFSMSVRVEREELQSLGDEWEDGCVNGFDESRLIALFSRLIRLHEQDWAMLRAIRTLADDYKFTEGDVLTLDKMIENSSCPLTPQHAEEMLWVADWRNGGASNGQSLEFCDLVAALVMPVRGPVGKLPPRPRRADPNYRSVKSSAGWHADRMKVTASINGTQAEVSSLLVDLTSDRPAADVDPWLRTVSHEDQARQDSGDFESFEFESEEVSGDQDEVSDVPPTGCKTKLYLLLEEPASSKAASIVWLFMGILILLSVLTMVLQPLISDDDSEDAQVWFVLDAVFTALFTLEFLLRLAVVDAAGLTCKEFLLAPSNICDFLAIMPLYVDFALGAAAKQFKLLRLVRLLRLTRISKIAKLTKKHPVFGPIAMVLVVVWFIYMKVDATS
eukprot:TRINITY_DN24965_c0_g1_i1.p1 TRINITY_DN24965_c0_g1~~TRINITY_DN24965_c0_g1_i1.p1  ORF type:complete len:1445 (+),score=305.67 TRINITY_DN24965_c0_g1_i1:40-4374(+)